ncbi:MAG: signal peptidase I [Lachnospiraceae bacterium]|nr:signal peptidase I [Lachnospiraceae bacterium]
MKVIRVILNILSWPVYLCIAVGLLIAAPMVAGYRPVVVLSGSMEPTYHVGSIIYYKEASFEQIAQGDPITFHSEEGGTLITHRVVEKSEINREFVTKGDANKTVDPNPVSYGNVAGKTSKLTIPYAGYLITIGRKPIVMAILAMILVMGMLGDNWMPEKEKG